MSEISKAILAGVAAAGTRTAAKESEARDTRPRFKNGRLKDEWERLNEELDIEMFQDPVLGAAYQKEHQTELDRFSILALEREKAARVASGLTAGGMTETEYERDRDRVLIREHNASVDRDIEKLAATKKAEPDPNPSAE